MLRTATAARQLRIGIPRILWLVVTAAIVLQSSANAVQAEATKPNILLILVDDLGYGELGCQGNREIPTPHIDSIAKNGIRFTSGYVTASYCSPSRAGLLTGRYQTRFGYELNPVGRHNLDPKAGLPTSEVTIADQLKTAGYETAMFGKWHLGGTEPFHPLNRGFDEFYGFLHEGHFFKPPPYDGVLSFLRKKQLPEDAKTRHRVGNVIYTSHMGTNEPPYDGHNPVLRGREPLVESAYLTDAITREAVAFLKMPREKPFFLYVPYNAVHSPLQARFEDMKPFDKLDVHRRVFAGMLANLDQNIGKLLKTLREKQLEENTFIIFLSDNGGPTKELTSSNRPLKGGKGNLYEGGIRVPFLIQWKGHLPGGKEYHQPVISTDLFATASALANVPLPKQTTYDGVDLMPYLSGEIKDRPHRTLYWRMQNKTALRHGDWKIVRNPARGDRQADFELYNLENDLAEEHDLAKTRPAKLNELKTIWSKLDGQMSEPAWRPQR